MRKYALTPFALTYKLQGEMYKRVLNSPIMKQESITLEDVISKSALPVADRFHLICKRASTRDESVLISIGSVRTLLHHYYKYNDINKDVLLALLCAENYINGGLIFSKDLESYEANIKSLSFDAIAHLLRQLLILCRLHKYSANSDWQVNDCAASLATHSCRLTNMLPDEEKQMDCLMDLVSFLQQFCIKH